MPDSEWTAYWVLALFNGANLVYLACYSVRDVLWLRILAVLAMLMLLPYYYWGTSEALWTCICWQFAFIAINLFWIGLIIRERQLPTMSDDEHRLYEKVFKNFCGPREMLRLVRAGQWRDVESGTRLFHHGQHEHRLMLIHEGTATVHVAHNQVALLGTGDLIGEMSYLTGEAPVADVFAQTPMRLLDWDRYELIGLFSKHVELKAAINELIGHDLVSKLTSQQAKVPELSIETLADAPGPENP